MSSASADCAFVHFGLIVTGETEAAHLPKLFRSLSATGVCHFKVIRRIPPLKARTSKKSEEQKKRELRITGTGYSIMNKDEETLGLVAKSYLAKNPCHFVLVIDDLEHDGRPLMRETFERYRTTLDALLKSESHRASFHFLVNMLEAYYFADARAINAVLGTRLDDYAGDVEDIRHPKNDLKRQSLGFREVEDGGAILEVLDLAHVLADPQTCRALRTLIAWCVGKLRTISYFGPADLESAFRLRDGVYSVITGAQ